MAGAALAGLVCVWLVVPLVLGVVNPPRAPGFDPAMPIPAHAAVGAEDAVRQVMESRFRAIAAADAQALRATTVEGSPARAELEPVAVALEAGDLRVEGMDVMIEDVSVVSALGRRVVAQVTYTVSTHTVWDVNGETAAAGSLQSVELDLLWSEAGWQVERVRPVPPAT
jgi:hypothetical protein